MFTGKCVGKYCYINCSQCEKTDCFGCDDKPIKCDYEKKGDSNSKARQVMRALIKNYHANK